MNRERPAHRPGFHFLPPANWMNDPNGLLQWRGRYHLFYQYNPNGAFHGTIHWGHAVSDDLVRWNDLPIALAPTPGGPDKDGVFSGCAVVHDGVPTIAYTGVGPEVQCVARAADPDDPDLIAWTKFDGNPVIAAPPPELAVGGFRDPFIWREDDGWYCAIGSGIKGSGGSVLLYRSRDLVRWEYVHELCRGDRDATGAVWECPNIFALDGKHVLIVSALPQQEVLYMIGEYLDRRFAPGRTSALEPGGSFYAPQVMRDARERWLIWGWLREARPTQAQRAAGWSGVMSLPRSISITDDGALCMRPVDELASLREGHARHAGVTLEDDAAKPLAEGVNMEIIAVVAPGNAQRAGFYVFESPDGAERTCVYYDRGAQALVIDRERASLDAETVRDVCAAPLSLAEGEPLTLRIFLDASVIEVFANDRVSMSSRVYPTLASSRGVRPFATGGAARVETLDVWRMQGIGRGGLDGGAGGERA